MISDKKIKAVFIGAGNLATNLAVALFNSNCHILQIYSRSENSAKQLATRVKSAYTTQISEIINSADLYFICVPDKIIPEIVSELHISNGIVAHTSGSTDIQILSNIKSTGYGIFYPFQSFSKNRIIAFNNIPICLNANNDKTFTALNSVASMISSKVIRMDSETLIWLHLTGIFVNNFTNHLLAISHQISSEKKFNFELLRPLIDETVKKAFNGNPASSQTGPAIRFDQNTINLHAEKLKEYKPELAEIYKALTLSIQSLAEKI
ncbi:MAG: DUF2520 domain-containing protein [Bacteroidales bacterium]|nr:DUF2520 domain-containing protein [Bacteroidales bacterium]